MSSVQRVIAHALYLTVVLGFAAQGWCDERHLEGDLARLPDIALQPPELVAPATLKEGEPPRGSQGVPSIAIAPGGRLWAAWYASRSQRGVESTGSYCVLATSGDGGRSWTEALLVMPRPLCRTYDPCLWLDPQNRLWFFWNQSAGMQDGRMGVWAIVTDEPDAAGPRWSQPRRIANGVMLNKPTVLKNGHWLLPVGLWPENDNVPNVNIKPEELGVYTNEMLKHDLGKERGTNVYRSTDQGRSFELLGQAQVPGTRVDEHMLVERRDGSLWMLVRNVRGIAQSESHDGGRAWSPGNLYLEGRMHANKRFFIRRLQSGALLMVRHNATDGARSHLAAFVSDDDGRTWHGGLLLDERECSYPDGVQAPDGRIYIIYDHQRYTLNRAGQRGSGSVVMAVFREEDARASKPASDDVRLRSVISQLQTVGPSSEARP